MSYVQAGEAPAGALPCDPSEQITTAKSLPKLEASGHASRGFESRIVRQWPLPNTT